MSIQNWLDQINDAGINKQLCFRCKEVYSVFDVRFYVKKNNGFTLCQNCHGAEKHSCTCEEILAPDELN